MTQHTFHPEPTNVQRAEWAKSALDVFIEKVYTGDHPDSMLPEDIESAVGDLICDLLHFARIHPRLDALVIHSHALAMFDEEVADEEEANRSAEPPADLLDTLLNIKILAQKSGDHEADPFALLDLIAGEVQSALAKATPK